MKKALWLANSLVIAGVLAFTGCKKEDITAPSILLNGVAEVTIDLGETYVDAGATATDDEDGDISSSITVNNPVNINQVGTYTITYNVSDDAGNGATEVTRTVKVRSNRLAGSYAVSDVVTGGDDDGTWEYDVTVTQSSVSYNTILIAGFGGFALSNVVATVEGSLITIASQSVNADGGVSVTISGTGTYNGAEAKITSINYTATGGLGSGAATYTKQ